MTTKSLDSDGKVVVSFLGYGWNTELLTPSVDQSGTFIDKAISCNQRSLMTSDVETYRDMESLPYFPMRYLLMAGAPT